VDQLIPGAKVVQFCGVDSIVFLSAFLEKFARLGILIDVLIIGDDVVIVLGRCQEAQLLSPVVRHDQAHVIAEAFPCPFSLRPNWQVADKDGKFLPVILVVGLLLELELDAFRCFLVSIKLVKAATFSW